MQHRRRFEAAVGLQVVLEAAAVAGTGNMAADRSMVSFSPRKRSAPQASTRQSSGRPRCASSHAVDRAVARLAGKARHRPRGWHGIHRPTFRLPGGKPLSSSATRSMSEPAQQPTAGRRSCRRRRHRPPPAWRCRCRPPTGAPSAPPGRQRAAAVAAGQRAGQVAVEMRENGAGNAPAAWQARSP